MTVVTKFPVTETCHQYSRKALVFNNHSIKTKKTNYTEKTQINTFDGKSVFFVDYAKDYAKPLVT